MSVLLSIGEIVINLISDLDQLRFSESHSAFRVFSGISDATMNFCTDMMPEVHGVKIFDSGGVWKLFSQDDRWLLSFHSTALGDTPYMLSVFSEDYSCGQVFVCSGSCNGSQVFELQHPLDELLIVNLLSQKRGALLHACLIDDDGRGMVFVGQSGAGKSTMAGLWERAGVTGIYSDDRVIVREHEGQFWAYGTPWHGTGRYASPKRVPLSGIFVLRQAHDNAARDLPPMQAVSQLFARSFPTFWNREGLDFTVGFLQRLCDAVPCYDLGFKPTEEIVAFVRGLNGSV